MATTVSPSPGNAAQFAGPTPSSRWPLWAGGIALAVLLVIGLPLHLCMPLWVDVTHYDIAARSVMQGGVHYRDIFDMNFPGILWLHIGIRALLGWSSVALRAVDVLILGTVIALLLRWLPTGCSAAYRVWVAVALAVFYLTTSEWSHCQRDPWMLLPALIALALRRRQVAALLAGDLSAASTLIRAWGEGLCWGAACWIKPFVVVPGLACWLVGVLVVAPGGRRAIGLAAADAAGLLAGGLTAGGLGLAWLIGSGSWPYFVDTMLNWNAKEGYYQWNWYGFRLTAWWVYWWFLVRLNGWNLIHLLAVPLALASLGRLLRAVPRFRDPAALAGLAPPGLFAAFYLGWLFQAVVLQQKFEYILVPPVLLAIVQVAQGDWLVNHRALRAGLIAGFVVVVSWWSPALRLERLAVWGKCWREGNSAEVRDALAVRSDGPCWVSLARVAEELRARGVQQGEVACYSLQAVPLYLELDRQPGTRFTMFETSLRFYPDRAPELWKLLGAGASRSYLVTDLRSAGLTLEQARAERSGEPLALPPDFPPEKLKSLPWSLPVVFRAGTYVVHQIK